jgi:uncharacterized protein (TIGR02996 family)
MTDREALLRSVIDSPEDDVPRLVFADWLEEHGETQRAEFIRVGCEFERLPKESPRRQQLDGWLTAMASTKYAEAWYAELPTLRGIKWTDFRRGFVESANVQVANSFLNAQEQIFAAAPINSLTFQLVKPQELEEVLASPLLRRLRKLNLSGNHIGDDGVELVAACPYLTGLKALELRNVGMGGRGRQALRDSPYLSKDISLDTSEERSLAAQAALRMLTGRER